MGKRDFASITGILLLVACHDVRPGVRPGTPIGGSDALIPKAAITRAIDRAIDFIRATQDSYGEFQSTVCDKKGFCAVDSTPFITTFVLSSLSPIRDARTAEMRERGVRFLRDEMLPGGLWRFWTFRAPSWVPILQPDLDDTVTAADILLSEGKLTVDNRALILRNMDSRGRFLTWLLPSERSVVFDFDPARLLKINEYQPRPLGWFGYDNRLFRWIRRNEFPNETDSAVNANVLLYLKEEIPSVCDYLNEVVVNDEPSVYYLGKPAQYYMYGRAYSHGIRCVAPSGPRIVASLLQMQDPSGAFGTVQNTVLSLNVLEDFGYRGAPVQSAARYLLGAQKPDGSWQDDFFFKESAFCKECRYWRSAAFTTALTVEALLKLETTSPPN